MNGNVAKLHDEMLERELYIQNHAERLMDLRCSLGKRNTKDVVNRTIDVLCDLISDANNYLEELRLKQEKGLED